MSEFMINIDLRGYSHETRERVAEAVDSLFGEWAERGLAEPPENAHDLVDKVINDILKEDAGDG